MPRLAPPARDEPATIPRSIIRPRRPFVLAFAAPGSPRHTPRITLGEKTLVEVAGMAQRSLDPDDWFAARVPAIPPSTGPLRADGISAGDLLEIEVLALEPHGRQAPDPLLVTIAVAPDGAGSGAAQVAIPAGGMAHMQAQRPGGLLSFGPIYAGRQRGGEHVGQPVPACLTVRVTVARPGSA